MALMRDLEPQVWSEKQFGTCELGDKRRTRRLVRYSCQMAEKPDASTPRQTESWSDCKAAYRMFQQEDVTFEAVTAPHYQQTQDLAPGTYLVVSDTTEIDYGYKSQRDGLGRLTASDRRGFFLHSALAITADEGHVVGIAAQELYRRPMEKRQRVNTVNGVKRATEFEVWGRVIDRVRHSDEQIKLIHVCDRGADNFDVFAHLHAQQSSWVIRAAQLTRKLGLHDGTTLKLSELMESLEAVGEYQVYVAANRKQKQRWASVEVRVASARLLQPRQGCTAFVKDNDIREISTNVVEVREANPPRGATPIRWVLYTGEPVSTFEEAMRVIGFYEKRPLVEEYHKGIKTGLRVEQRQYQTHDRLEPLIGVICVHAVRLLQLRDIARRAPDTPAKRIVPPEWLAVLGKVLKRPRPLNTVREFIRALASLGGFLGRKSDGEPGWQTIWLGLETLIVAIRGYNAGLQKCG